MPRDKTATYEKIIRCMKEEFLAFGYENFEEELIRKEAEVNKEYADILRTSGVERRILSGIGDGLFSGKIA